MRYIHDRPGWSDLTWRDEQIVQPLARVRYRQGRLLGHMQALGFALRNEADHHIAKPYDWRGALGLAFRFTTAPAAAAGFAANTAPRVWVCGRPGASAPASCTRS